MPLRRLNPKRRPGESIMDWSGPKLEEFTSAPSESVSPESGGTTTKPPFEKPPILPDRKAALKYLTEEMTKRGWKKATFAEFGFAKGGQRVWIAELHIGDLKGKWGAYENPGGTGGMTTPGHLSEDPFEASDELIKMLTDKDYFDLLQAEDQKRTREGEEGTPAEYRAVNQQAIIPEENVEEEEHGDELDAYRAGMGYYEDAFNKATNGEFYDDLAGKGFSVTSITEFKDLLAKHPQAIDALAAGFANLKAFVELEGSPEPNDIKLINQVAQLLARYGRRIPEAEPPLKEWPFKEIAAEAEKLGWYVEKGLSSNSNLFLREKGSEQRSVSLDREATGLWIAYGEGGKFTSPSLKKAGDWLIADLKSLRTFKPGDYVGAAGLLWSHNIYRLISPGENGNWTVENIEHMPKHQPQAVLNEKDMVKIIGYLTPEQEEAEALRKKREYQKKHHNPEELRAYLKGLRERKVPEDLIKPIEESFGVRYGTGGPEEDPIKFILRQGYIHDKNLKEVPVEELLEWPNFKMADGEVVDVKDLKIHTAGIAPGAANSFIRNINSEAWGGLENPESEKSIEAKPLPGGRNAELPDGTLLRTTPPGQKNVEQMVKLGDIIHEISLAPGMVGFSGKPYEKDHMVIAVHKYEQYGLPVYSLSIVDKGEKPTGKNGRYRETQLGSINELVAQDGVIKDFFQEGDSEYRVIGHESISGSTTLTGQVEVEPEEEEPDEE